MPDSLQAALRAAPAGRARGAVLLRIVACFDTPDPDSAAMLGYANEAGRLGRSLHDTALLGRAPDAGSNHHLTVQRFEPAAALELEAAPRPCTAPATPTAWAECLST